MQQKILILKTEAHPVHHLVHRFASKKAKGKEELLENTDMHISGEVCFHFRGGEGWGAVGRLFVGLVFKSTNKPGPAELLCIMFKSHQVVNI